jgi:broad specificity phosphatase PhoE
MIPTRGQAFTGRLDEATRSIMPSTEVTSLHLLRHGDVEKLTERIVRGQLDVDVSEAGAFQHEALATWLNRAEPRPDGVYSSDLKRCRGLAERVANLSGCSVTYDVRLREQNMGSWEGLTWPEVTRRDADGVRRYWADYSSARPGGGETLADVAGRALQWWGDMLGGCGGQRIAVVTHIGVIRVLLCNVLRLPLAEALRFAPATASHTSLLLAEAGPVLSSFGERPWL